MVDQFLDDADNARLARQSEHYEREETDGGVREVLLRLLGDLTQDA